MQNITKSKDLFGKSQQVLVGGVNSPVRAFLSVGGTPRFIRQGKGAYLYDEDGNRYIDFVGSWGPLILGHAHPKVTKAVSWQLKAGSSYGAPTRMEYLLAKKIIQAFPSVEKIRFVSSGTEAVQSAIRVARGYTGREKIVKFEGCYHGHTDSLLVKAGSGGATFGIPTSRGVPQTVVRQTIVLPFNDDEAVKRLFEQEGKDIAAAIVEPIAANMGVVLPKKSFLRTLREKCAANGALLIYDEVITGFRIAFGGAQEWDSVSADLTCFGKIIGGGFPVGAYGGPKKIMSLLSPEGDIYQAGTLSGNPVAMVAGLTTLQELGKKGVYHRLQSKTEYLCHRLEKIIRNAKYPCQLNWTTGMFTLFFNCHRVTDFVTASQSDTKRFSDYFHAMLECGIYLPPSQFEANFISLSHSREDFDTVLEKIEEYLVK